MRVIIRPGLRTFIFALYVILSISSLIVLNQYFMFKHSQVNKSFDQIQFNESLNKLSYATPEDSMKANALMQKYGESLLSIRVVLRETQMYSILILIGLIIVSGILFTLIMLWLSKPLVELKEATDQIRQGNFSVHLPETGIFEMKSLKNSFNRMSHELETTQKRLLVAEKEMIWKDLSRILAHEIKNPLTPIQLAVQRLDEKQETEPDKVCEMLPDTLKIIQQEIENLRLLAQDFSSFAKIAQPQFESFDPAVYTKEILASYQDVCPLKLNLEPEHLIRFDRTHFYQILTNIVQNAIDASAPDSPIEVSITANKSFVILSVKDYGSGIEPDDMNRIFEPYFSRKNRGTGLGLALVKRLVEANQSVIRAKSKLGEGSEFILIIEDVMTKRSFLKEEK
ncbi:MAG: HAMP domain-containing histidine kinase [Candidatus Cloacimonetes bacterium]|nr:HAMP domain-containing histidine kinase [Candidatus Cloacimonadota bacterium]